MTENYAPENKWTFGRCFSSHKWRGPGTYVEKCCLPGGIHLLTCETSRNKNDWSSNVVMILGHRFCDDFVGYQAVLALNISGTL